MSVTAAPVVADDGAPDVPSSAVEHIRVPPQRI
jgi:hypothetical protein